MPMFRWRLVVRRGHRVPALARFERREAAAALRSWGCRPVAPVAVIIPTFRRPHNLPAAIASVLSQSHRDLVVAVLDDGAGLGPLPDDPRVFAYSLSRNCGISGVVRNIGIRATASRYLAFLDDDNTWAPEHLEVSLRAHDQGAELTYTALERRLPDGSLLDTLSVPFDRARSRRDGFADANALVVRRGRGASFSRVPMRRGEFPMEDWELVHRLSRRLHTVHVPEATVRYAVHDGSYFTDWSVRAPGQPAAEVGA